jgi:hypothetical protein
MLRKVYWVKKRHTRRQNSKGFPGNYLAAWNGADGVTELHHCMYILGDVLC